MNFSNPNLLAQRLFPQQPQINPQQFASVAASLDDNSLNKLIQMARARGISDQDIQAGLNIINQYRKR